MDWDDDGSLDLILRNRSAPRVQVYHNRYANPGNFISFELEGNGKTSNRDAIGAQVTIEVEGKSIVRGLRAGEGFLAQSSKRVHFGVGDARRIERVSVRWPDGSRSSFEDLLAGKRYRINQAGGVEGLSQVAMQPVDFDQLSPSVVADQGSSRRAVLAYPLPLAELSVPSFENPKRKVRDLAGSPVLLNLWQVTCSGCLVEFGDFRDHRDELAATDLRIVTLNADADPDHPVSPEEVQHMLERFGRNDADAGFVGSLMPSMMNTLERHIYGEAAVSGEVVMPTSWLLDGEGNLLVIYRGPVNLERLFEDLEALEAGPKHLTLDRLSNGRRLVNPKRKLYDLAMAFADRAKAAKGLEAGAYQKMSEYYLAEDERQRGFFIIDGETREIPDPRYGEKRKTRQQQLIEQADSGLDGQ